MPRLVSEVSGQVILYRSGRQGARQSTEEQRAADLGDAVEAQHPKLVTAYRKGHGRFLAEVDVRSSTRDAWATATERNPRASRRLSYAKTISGACARRASPRSAEGSIVSNMRAVRPILSGVAL